MPEDGKKSTVCRACLNSENEMLGNLYSLFDTNKLAHKFVSISNITVKEGDGLPDRICGSCLSELENAYSFQSKCIASNQILYSSLNGDVPLVGDDVPIEKGERDVKEEAVCYIKDETEYIDYDYLEEHELPLAALVDDNSDNSIQVEHESPVTSNEKERKSRAIDLKLICDDCGESFKSKCKIKVHWRKVHLKERLICDLCKRQFKTYKAFNTHKKQKNRSCVTASKVRVEGIGKKRVFYCKDCDYKSIRIQDMQPHILTHTGDRPHLCELCSKSYTQLSSLLTHKEQVHRINRKETTCPYCGKFLSGRNMYYKHIKSHKFPTYPCKVCNKILKSKDTLKQHMMRHTGVRNFKCDFCPGKFFTSSELGNHKQKVHLKNKIYDCDKCEFKSIHYSSMSKHRKRHTDNNVPCELCGIFLDNNDQLILHQKRHFERNFKCEFCHQKYFSKKNLLNHIRNIHKKKTLVSAKQAVNTKQVKL